VIVPDIILLVYGGPPRSSQALVGRSGQRGGESRRAIGGFNRLAAGDDSPKSADGADLPSGRHRACPGLVSAGSLHAAPRWRRASDTPSANFDAACVGANPVVAAHIAALAMEYQAEVHSNDSDFGRFPGLRWRDPLRVARRPPPSPGREERPRSIHVATETRDETSTLGTKEP